MKALITGGLGFIGRHLIDRFLDHHVQIRIIDIKSGKDILSDDLPPTSADVMVHLAAQLEILDVDAVRESELNVKGTIKMLEYCRKLDIPRFVFASSAAVYGEPIQLPSYEFDEMRPFWSYGASKAAGEIYCKQYEELYGIKTVIVRPSIITGLGEWYGRFITLSLARIKNKEPILVFGDGTQTRDFLDVRDCAELFYLAATSKQANGIYNAGSGRQIAINDMAKLIQKIAHHYNEKVKVVYVNPKVGELGRKLHELHRMELGNEKALHELGWIPRYNIKMTVAMLYKAVIDMNLTEFHEWTKIARY